ncbi:MAG: hypothetical protein RR585_14950 [Coprobacillus sp.]
MDSIYVSLIGIVYMVLLFVPNMIWIKHQPIGYDPSNENKILLIFERIGEVLVTAFSVVVFLKPVYHINICLIASMLLMILYECSWIRYLKSKKELIDFYRPLLRIPVPGAILPVISFFLLGIYQMNVPLMISSIVLGIGHIGIHLQHFHQTKT